MDPMTLYMIGTVATTLFTTGFSYFQEQGKLDFAQKEKKQQLKIEMQSLLEDQKRFEARSGTKSPMAQTLIQKNYEKAIARIK